MKLIICVILMLITTKECDKTQKDMVNNASQEMADRQSQEIDKITYQAATRGFFLKIWVEGDTLSYTNDYNLQDVKTHKISEEQRTALNEKTSQFDMTKLSELKSPSESHQFDGAAIATFEATKGDETYKTNAFDHQNPPKEIKALVEKLLSMKAMMEKQ
ncbi:hypothetical protein ACU8DI_04525 [Psychroserpens sp. BH13MA-6]